MIGFELDSFCMGFGAACIVVGTLFNWWMAAVNASLKAIVDLLVFRRDSRE